MCGIVGIVHPGQSSQELVVRRMAKQLEHRGPDEEGFWCNDDVGLGHQRLSIIDLATGQQPMVSSQTGCALVFNGEIYNYRELRAALTRQGHKFQTKSDTECVLRLYEQKGADFLDDLRGMFALAVWDPRSRELVLACDRVGKKPLYYTQTDSGFAFASELKSLLVVPGVSRDVDPVAIDEYLTYQYVPAPRSIFRGIRKLLPAHRLVLRDGRMLEQPYWELSYRPKVDISVAEAEEQTLALADEAVRIRLESEVPLGCFLSGGVDSSAVVAFMRRHITGDLRTFSIGFQEGDFNELPYARQVAEKFETKHEEFVVEPNALDILPKIVWHFDEPFGDVAALPSWYLAQMTRRHVTVALNGDGGDESFCGYRRYSGLNELERYQRIPRAVRVLAEATLPRLPRGLQRAPLVDRALHLQRLTRMDEATTYAHAMMVFRSDLRHRIYSPDFAATVGDHEALDVFRASYGAAFADDAADRKMRSDIATYLPGALLPKVDRTSMAHSLECRSPFLDHVLMEHAARLPVSLKFPGGNLKHHLKESLANGGVLPREWLYRKKQGFSVPVGSWFKGDLRGTLREQLTSPRFQGRGWFDVDAVSRMIDHHERGQQNHTHRLWLLLMLELWAQTFVDGNGAQPMSPLST